MAVGGGGSGGRHSGSVHVSIHVRKDSFADKMCTMIASPADPAGTEAPLTRSCSSSDPGAASDLGSEACLAAIVIKQQEKHAATADAPMSNNCVHINYKHEFRNSSSAAIRLAALACLPGSLPATWESGLDQVFM